MGNLVDICHETEHRPILAYDENRDYDSWRSQIKEKLTELLGRCRREQKRILGIRRGSSQVVRL